jgi:hypothetical protein
MKKLLTNKKVIAAFVGALAAAGVVALVAKSKTVQMILEDPSDD